MNTTNFTTTNHIADAETFSSALIALRAVRMPIAGLIKSWIGESVDDNGKVSRVIVRSTGFAVNGLVSWVESEVIA